jgi:hypothetical protein
VSREHLVCGLVEEVLGPRNGIRETHPLTTDPADEYITGVLAPEGAAAERDPDADAELLETGDSVEEDSEQQHSVDAPPEISPSLDPRVLPKSFGISFLAQHNNNHPRLSICLTWARYTLSADAWTREPAHAIFDNVDVSRNSSVRVPGDLRLEIRSRRQGPTSHRFHVSVYVVNARRFHDRYTTPDMVFQPQIRIRCGAATTLIPLERLREEGAERHGEEAELALLYRNFSPLARGHLCGAIWREIDPERMPPDGRRRERAPFAWRDGEIVPERERTLFSDPDLRTDFTPMIPVSAPSMQWRGAGEPLLDPDRLAETWQADDLRQALLPLVEGYEQWVRQLESQLPGLGRHRASGTSLLARCQSMASRLRQGLDILCDDQDLDPRLAFAFANKAMAKQAGWAQRSLRWYPFQLAFLLINVRGISKRTDPDRRVCDLLWMPTGGGKTEAYLAVAIFSLALRRLKAEPDHSGERSGAGTGVISRYTLRLLTVQQFRRALRAITACEVLRVDGLAMHRTGWRPADCPVERDYLWGTAKFSIGLWVGSGVTPNALQSFTAPSAQQQQRFLRFLGGLEMLWGARDSYSQHDTILARAIRGQELIGNAEPAQVTNCPCCSAVTAVPNRKGLPAGRHTLHFLVDRPNREIAGNLSWDGRMTVLAVRRTSHRRTYETISLDVEILGGGILPRDLDHWWHQIALPGALAGTRLKAVRPSRMGYFFRTYTNQLRNVKPYDFEIHCPNPECELNRTQWQEKVPIPDDADQEGRDGIWFPQSILAPYTNEDRDRTGWSTPIPAYTVDDQIYQRCPSMIVATADKLARLAFDPDGSTIFGNVEFYHAQWGYYRRWAPMVDGPSQQAVQHPRGRSRLTLRVPVGPMLPPDLVIQDELHLIEGPLGSMVGIYESAVDILCRECNVKYIASSATVRHAESQVRSLFDRDVAMFPPPGFDQSDNFFSRTPFEHPLDSARPGRLYVGICSPGKGSQTPIIRTWSSLLSTADQRLRAGAPSAEIDPYWTLIAYFNAVRELAGAAALYRQDIPQRMGNQGRQLGEQLLELSSRMDSTELPTALERLEQRIPEAEDVVLTTAMFGTGVDVARLGLIFVNGQPKTTSAYIQATGRVGRTTGGLVVSFLKAARPRDLDHYEFFTGYHRALYRFVEPITVAPFSPRCRERSLGPLSVLLLRQARVIDGIPVNEEWRIQQRLGNQIIDCRARRMADQRHSPEVEAVIAAIEQRSQAQPIARRPPAGEVEQDASSELDRWQQVAAGAPSNNDLVYDESTMLRPPARRVVLGDDPHQLAALTVVYRNAPQSLRDVESTTTFET